MKDWNELRLVLALARSGNLVAAAKQLSVDHSTAFRRLNTIEEKLGVRLFDRRRTGAYTPTPAGERMAAAAERMEDEALALERDIAGGDRRLSGRLRVTSAETLTHRILTPYLAAFRNAHPGIVVEFAIDNRVLSLTRREADVAVRPARPSEGDLWGRKLADIAWAVYASPSLLRKAGGTLRSVEDLARHPIVGWDEMAPRFGAAGWLERLVPPANFTYRTASLVNQLAAAKSSIGIAALPCYLGDPEPGLVRAVREPLSAVKGELWIVTHSDLKKIARIQAFFDLVGGQLAARRTLFEGHEPQRRRLSLLRQAKKSYKSQPGQQSNRLNTRRSRD